MLLIPIGLKQDEVRRHPWVSYAIIAANVAVFLLLQLAWLGSDVADRFREKGEKVVEYLFERPYLKIPEELAPLCDERFLASINRAREAYKSAARVPDAWELRLQQQKLNALAKELTAVVREAPVLRYGYAPAHPTPGTAVSSLFVHSGWLHLIGNMLFFFATGPFLEDVLGRLLFTLLYVFSGWAGLAAHAWQNPGSLAPVVGASGAIAGVMGAFLIRLGASRIHFLCVPIVILPWIRFRLFIPAFVFLPLWFLGQFWFASSAQGASGVAFWAHVGGFVFGAAVALLVRLTRLEEKFIHPLIESQVSWTQNTHLVRAIEAQSRGDRATARRETGRVLSEQPNNVDAWRLAYETAFDEHDWKAYANAATRLLELYVHQGERDLARNLIEEASGNAFEELPAKFHLRAGSFLEKEGRARAAVRFYKRLAERYPDDPAVLRSLLRTADILADAGDATGARDALRRVLAHPACGDVWRTEVVKRRERLGEG